MSMKTIRLFMLLFVVVFFQEVQAQEHDLIFTIQNYLQQGEIQKAKQASDSAITTNSLKKFLDTSTPKKETKPAPTTRIEKNIKILAFIIKFLKKIN